MGDLRDNPAGTPGEQPVLAQRAAPAGTEFAGFWQRLFALWIDMALLGCVGAAIGAMAYNQVAALGQEGRFIGAAITLVYYGFLNSRWGGGATLGKRLLGLRVIRRDGQPIGLLQALLRTIVFWTPWYLNGVFIPAKDIPGLSQSSAIGIALGVVLALIVFGGMGLIVYLYLFNRRTRQSLHDIVAGTFVVRAESADATVQAHFWKGHLALGALACLLVVAIPIALLFYASGTQVDKVLDKTTAVQNAVLAVRGVDTASVQVNTLYMTSSGGQSVTTTLIVDVRMRSAPVSMETAQDDIAAAVLKAAPTNLDQQNLRIGVAYGYDLGIFKWTNANNYAATPDEWRKKLAQRHAGEST
jgi:uncharacterized RDD family membrane protein YckC